MEAVVPDTADRLAEPPTYLYDEYARLSALVDQMARESFADFKLLGAVGAVLAWPPFATVVVERLLDADADAAWFPPLLLGGFLFLLLLVAIIATRDLLRQSIIRYHLQHLRGYEREIARRLEPPGSGAFQVASGWPSWQRDVHTPISSRFVALFTVLLVAFPAAVLAAADWRLVPVHLVCAAALFWVYLGARARLPQGPAE